MSFSLKAVHGTAEQLDTQLDGLTQHERESTVVPVVQESVKAIVNALGGYLSISVNGNINPLAGETGDLIHIYITSLPTPDAQPVTETTPVSSGLETTPEEIVPPVTTEDETPKETAEEGAQREAVEAAEKVAEETTPITPLPIDNNPPPPLPPVASDNGADNPPVAPQTEPVATENALVDPVVEPAS